MQSNAATNLHECMGPSGGRISIDNGRYWFNVEDAEAIAHIRRQARAAALEEAAKACDSAVQRQGTLGRQIAVTECAASIRALK